MRNHPAPAKPCSDEHYRRERDRLRPRILNAHFAIRPSRARVIVLIGGVEGAGKGEVVRRLNEWLDPRGVETHTFWEDLGNERRRRTWWPFHHPLPARGRVGILFGSWYTDPVVRRLAGRWKKKRFQAALGAITRSEEMLALDGAIFLKLWFHISKKTLKRRLNDLARHPELHWTLLPDGSDLLEVYEEFVKISKAALHRTDTLLAPWHFIEAEDQRHRDLVVARLLCRALTDARRFPSAIQRRPAAVLKSTARSSIRAGVLSQVDPSLRIPEQVYHRKLKKLQAHLLQLSWRLYERERPCLLLFEGWDAAGKGGAIRRVTHAIDPRLYHVVAFRAPTDEEKAQHYFWRFYRQLPRPGRTTIFDRSYYGRVLVERVEGFAPVEEWSRAYDEINEFETQLLESGILLCKFWLHISPDEQLRRFRAREKDPLKRYKITEEDWRNREKWGLYEAAVEEMLARTNPVASPWWVIAANDKNYARIDVLERLCHKLELELK